MTPTTFSVHIERPGKALNEIMNEIRLWLDNHKIEPVAFKTLPTTEGSVAFDIRFQSRDEAGLFEREFA